MLIGRPALRALCRAREFLESDDETPLSVEALAAQAGMPRGRFIAMFSAVYGSTPHQVRIAARLQRAQRLLRQGDTVTDVCMAVGCSSLGSFSTAFKQRTGLSPLQWQKTQRTLAQVPARQPIVAGCFGLLTALPASAFRR